MGQPIVPGRRLDVACPFCGLACDDLVVEASADRLQVLAAGCSLSRAGFERSVVPAQPQIDGRPVEMPVAVQHAAQLMQASRMPVFAAAADVAGVRMALRLADRLGGVIDHPASDGLVANLQQLQDSGWISTTLSEVRNRADFLLMVGPDPSAAFPRFLERCVSPAKTLFVATPLQRTVTRLGPPPTEPDDTAIRTLVVPEDRLSEAVSALGALVRGRPIASAGLSRATVAGLAELAAGLKAARYGVLVWAAGLLDFSAAPLIVRSLVELVRELNKSTRCAVLPLGGTDNLVGANQVTLWQTGLPLRTSFGSGHPEHDPFRFAARRLVEYGEADLLIWIAAFGELPPPPTDTRLILLAPPQESSRPSAAVYIPVGIPGVDHGGQMFRTDSVVALRLAALRDLGLPSVASVLTAIEAQLDGGRGDG